jgi:hypothetical protein
MVLMNFTLFNASGKAMQSKVLIISLDTVLGFPALEG